MQIIKRKKFDKKFKQLSPKLKEKIKSAIKLFAEDPHNPILKNHALKGQLEGLRAFSVTGDVRVIFKAYDDYVLVIMLGCWNP